jgi:hypothetical protein
VVFSLLDAKEDTPSPLEVVCYFFHIPHKVGDMIHKIINWPSPIQTLAGICVEGSHSTGRRGGCYSVCFSFALFMCTASDWSWSSIILHTVGTLFNQFDSFSVSRKYIRPTVPTIRAGCFLIYIDRSLLWSRAYTPCRSFQKPFIIRKFCSSWMQRIIISLTCFKLSESSVRCPLRPLWSAASASWNFLLI